MTAGAINVHNPARATTQLTPAACRPAEMAASTAMMMPRMISSDITGRAAVDKTNPATMSQRPRMKLIQLNAFILKPPVGKLHDDCQFPRGTGGPIISSLAGLPGCRAVGHA